MRNPLPGYDAWKLASPEDARGGICPFCGSCSTSQCEFEDDTECPWDEAQPDPDQLRDLREDKRDI